MEDVPQDGDAGLMMEKSVAAPVIPLYHLENYTFGTKDPQREKDNNVGMRMERLERNYHKFGMRRSVDAVLLVHNHGHPHVLLLQIGQSFFKLPGGRLRPGEDEVAGLKRKLTKRLAAHQIELRPEWEISDLVSMWWRPHFEPHLVSSAECMQRAKEQKKIFLVLLPEYAQFAVPSNLRLLAVPLFELYDNPGKFGPSLAALPAVLSRFTFHHVERQIATDDQQQQEQQQPQQ